MLPYEIVQHTYADPWTHVLIRERTRIGKQTFTLMGEGFARRSSTDAPNRQVGFEVALVRAREQVRQRRKKMKGMIA